MKRVLRFAVREIPDLMIALLTGTAAARTAEREDWLTLAVLLFAPVVAHAMGWRRARLKFGTGGEGAR